MRANGIGPQSNFECRYLRGISPLYHFSPEAHWMNDPNGMFYKDGTYHLYFQYYPEGNQWGPMHWGHASTKDLVHWTEHPIAIYPDTTLGFIFSGSAVIDTFNVSGLAVDSTPPSSPCTRSTSVQATSRPKASATA